jgi:hypothetical protein
VTTSQPSCTQNTLRNVMRQASKGTRSELAERIRRCGHASAALLPPMPADECSFVADTVHATAEALADMVSVHPDYERVLGDERLIFALVHVLASMVVDADRLGMRLHVVQTRPGWAVPLDHGEVIVETFRPSGIAAGLFFARTMRVAKLDAPQLDSEAIDRIASALADAVLAEVQ